MSIESEIAGALEEAETAVPRTFQHDGHEYSWIRSSVTRSRKADIGGVNLEYDLSGSVRLDELGEAVINERDTIIDGTRRLRVDKIIEDPTGTFIRLFCIYEKAK